MKRIITLCLLFLALSGLKSFAQPKCYINGYYLTLQGDTVVGELHFKDMMYLKYKSPDGREKKFSPSDVKGFTIQGKEYASWFMEQYNTKRFFRIEVRGYYSLLSFEDYHSQQTTFFNGTSTGGIGFYADNNYSGYYLQKPGSDFLLPIPKIMEKLRKFITEHFADDPVIMKKAEEGTYSVDSIFQLFREYNEYQDKLILNK
ncbi:MAG: hypothetical protein HXX13_13240 [Bacteroidetes bacterium]|nr:hypothetical protein [Bacteroidota bacterium]